MAIIFEACGCYDNGVCNGTRERDICNCYGNEAKCDFYPEKRKKADRDQLQQIGNELRSGKITMDEARGIYDTPRILDSGDRTEFASGAVRDMREGKGRCDLLPLDVVGDMLNSFVGENGDKPLWTASWTIAYIADFMATGDTYYLFKAIKNEDLFEDPYTMLLEVAKHFEEGAKKYGDNNWRKGIPVNVYIDSAVRHYLKFRRGDKDEPHDRAFCWNILCAVWTCKHMPELNPYKEA